MAQRRADVFALETAVVAHISALVPLGCGFQPQVKVESASSRLLLDGLLTAPTGLPDIIIEIKVSAAARIMPLAVDQALATNHRYQRVTGRESFAWLIVILPEPAARERAQRSHKTAGVDLLSDAMVVTVAGSPGDISEIPTLPIV